MNMKEIVEEYRGYRICREPDEEPIDPRTYSQLGIMYCGHRKYNLGDVEINSLREFLTGIIPFDIDDWTEEEALDWVEDNVLYLPLYLYDHSGLTMSTKEFASVWDSGQVGYIAVTKKRIKEVMNWQRLTKKREAEVYNILRGEVEEYDYYLRGDIWIWFVEDPSGEILEACGGFYGDDKSYLEEARSLIDQEIVLMEFIEEGGAM